MGRIPKKTLIFLINFIKTSKLLSETINVRQSQLEKLYDGLKDLAEERRGKLDETHKLYQLIREVCA